MSMIFLAAMMIAQTTTDAQPEPAQAVVTKAKPKQICQYLEITGSRTRKRVCADENGVIDAPMGVAHGAPNAGMLHQAPSGSGEPPGQGLNPGGR